MEVTTIIIDDQTESIEDLKYLIEKNKLPLKVVATANSGSDGLIAILKHKPQLVFLDIVMPGMSGFEMLDLIPDINFNLIVTTSVDKFAVQAIRSSALDFLLKPVKPGELKDAVDRVIKKSSLPTSQQFDLLKDTFKERDRPIKKIALPVTDGVDLVLLSEILYFESEGNYTTVHMRNGKETVVSKQIGKFEEIVENTSFYRVHSSFLVNVNHINKVVRSDGGYLVLENGKSISIARNRREAFLEYINKG